MFLSRRKTSMVSPDDALPGRDTPIDVPDAHHVLGTPMTPPFPDGLEQAQVGMGCFWGAERAFWKVPGVYTTAVGYAGGYTPHPTYEEVCSTRTGHTEAVLVVFDPSLVTYAEILRVFWESHDPTQGMRQGNDAGTQYRSAIYWDSDAQRALAESTRDAYQEGLSREGFGTITTEIAAAGPFYYAEPYHQQYHAKNLARSGVDVREYYLGDTPPPRRPSAVEGYCSMEPTGVSCPIGLGVDVPPEAGEARGGESR